MWLRKPNNSYLRESQQIDSNLLGYNFFFLIFEKLNEVNERVTKNKKKKELI